MHSTLIGFDFSLVKPTCCIYHNHQFEFMSWPKIDEDLKQLYRNSAVKLIDREDTDTDCKNMSLKARQEVINSNYISDLIIDSLKPYLNRSTLIAMEGSSFGSSGNVVIQLSSRRYFLMNELSNIIPLDNIYTYSPITVKITANCSFKGSKKSDMIKSFMKIGPKCKLREDLNRDERS